MANKNGLGSPKPSCKKTSFYRVAVSIEKTRLQSGNVRRPMLPVCIFIKHHTDCRSRRMRRRQRTASAHC
jgi:hypothetical protein